MIMHGNCVDTSHKRHPQHNVYYVIAFAYYSASPVPPTLFLLPLSNNISLQFKGSFPPLLAAEPGRRLDLKVIALYVLESAGEKEKASSKLEAERGWARVGTRGEGEYSVARSREVDARSQSERERV
ncbi:hypothetical protein EI94DRAFT_1700855 [Lactarius quietus]|nr:hypothetical protein EI94DRAFT_1700855 [Lactarius quietus]